MCVYVYFIQFDSLRGSEREGLIGTETDTRKGRARNRKTQGGRQRVKRKKKIGDGRRGKEKQKG